MGRPANPESHAKQILAVLVAKGVGYRMTSKELRKASGVPDKLFHTYVNVLRRSGMLSHNKLPTDSNTLFRYFLTATQMISAYGRYKFDFVRKPEELVMLTDAIDIPKRLAFLYKLRENTVFGDHAELKAIISDYERTQALRRKVEQARDEQEKEASA